MVIIRLILTVILCFGIYEETGYWTALSFGLVFFTIEAITWHLRKLDKFLKENNLKENNLKENNLKENNLKENNLKDEYGNFTRT